MFIIKLNYHTLLIPMKYYVGEGYPHQITLNVDDAEQFSSRILANIKATDVQDELKELGRFRDVDIFIVKA